MNEIIWRSSLSIPRLTAGEIHLWRARLNLSPEQLEIGRSLMSANELERADRLITDILRNRRVAGQSILRDILSRYLGAPASEIVFSHGERKKPYIQGSDIQFNMSHTEDIALVAITLLNPIGVDVEGIKTSKYHEGIVKSNYSVQERLQYESIPESQKLEAFFRAWTRKEAYIKAIGLGLYYPLEKFTVDLSSTSEKGLISIEGSTEKAKNWHLPSFYADERFMAAVAIEAEIKNWLFLDWQNFNRIG